LNLVFYWYFVIVINEYPEAGLTASISVQHSYYEHNTNTIITL